MNAQHIPDEQELLEREAKFAKARQFHYDLMERLERESNQQVQEEPIEVPLNESVDRIMMGKFGDNDYSSQFRRLRAKKISQEKHLLGEIDQERFYEMAKIWRRSRKTGMKKGHCVYLIEGLPGVFKIGKTKDVRSRLMEMQVGCPTILKLVAAIPALCSSSNGTLEAHLHEHFAECRIHGEWFEFNQATLDEFIQGTEKWLVKYNRPSFKEAA